MRVVSETMNATFQTTGRSRSGRIHGFRAMGNSALWTVPKDPASFQYLEYLTIRLPDQLTYFYLLVSHLYPHVISILKESSAFNRALWSVFHMKPTPSVLT